MLMRPTAELRRLLLNEPRGSGPGAVIPLVPTTVPEADIGMMVWLPDGAHAMSGSNAMCAVTALLEMGTLPITGPETTITLDTASGLVKAIASCRDGKVTSVRVSMPEAFMQLTNVAISTEEWGRVPVDVCFGGVYYAVVDAASIGVPIRPENAQRLAQSVIGSEFVTEITAETQIGDLDAMKTDLIGSCWIFGISQLGLDPSDPFPEGFSL